MIDDPLNDTECLGQLTEVAARATKTPEARALATRFATTAALAEHIRSLPQRDDAGDPADGPRVACDVSQRARLFPADPNCVVMSSCRLCEAPEMPTTDRPLTIGRARRAQAEHNGGHAGDALQAR